MRFRSPTAADIGKTVEVSNDQQKWRQARLVSISRFGVLAECEIQYDLWSHCRVPYSSPDPIAELSMAADLLAERGAPEAAALLLKAVAVLTEGKDIIGKCPLGVHFEGPYLQRDFEAWRDYMLRLTPNPEPQP